MEKDITKQNGISLSKSEKQLKDAIHKTTKQFVDWCIENEVKEVAFGDVEGVERNTSRRKRKGFA